MGLAAPGQLLLAVEANRHGSSGLLAWYTFFAVVLQACELSLATTLASTAGGAKGGVSQQWGPVSPMPNAAPNLALANCACHEKSQMAIGIIEGGVRAGDGTSGGSRRCWASVSSCRCCGSRHI